MKLYRPRSFGWRYCRKYGWRYLRRLVYYLRSMGEAPDNLKPPRKATRFERMCCKALFELHMTNFEMVRLAYGAMGAHDS